MTHSNDLSSFLCILLPGGIIFIGVGLWQFFDPQSALMAGRRWQYRDPDAIDFSDEAVGCSKIAGILISLLGFAMIVGGIVFVIHP